MTWWPEWRARSPELARTLLECPKFVYIFRPHAAASPMHSRANLFGNGRLCAAHPHAAMINQLRIPSLTPSHNFLPCVFNGLRHGVFFILELTVR